LDHGADLLPQAKKSAAAGQKKTAVVEGEPRRPHTRNDAAARRGGI